MTLAARQQRILQRLRAEQREWLVDELATRLGVSAITVRRDLEALARQGLVLRTHGGCLYAGRMLQEAAYHRRVADHFDAKQAIGRRAAREVRSGEAILIDDGSTCFHVAVQLQHLERAQLFTNSMPVVAALAAHPGVRVTLLGGEYNAELQHLGGPVTETALEQLQFDRVFLGADAIDREGRVLVRNEELARTAQVMLRRGRRQVLLADHTKYQSPLGRVAYARLADFDEWITTTGLAPARRRQFARLVPLTLVAVPPSASGRSRRQGGD